MNKSLLFVFSLLLYSTVAIAEIIPLSMQSRVAECQTMVVGKVVNTISYWDATHSNIYTLHDIEITGVIKGSTNATNIGLVDLGGTVGTERQETHPSVHLGIGDVGLFMLGGDIDDNIKLSNYNHSPTFIQALPTASVQGAILYHGGMWHDPSTPNDALTTQQLFRTIQELTGGELTNPLGQALDISTLFAQKGSHISNKTLSVTTLQNGTLATTNTFNAGVSNNAAMEMIINGSGFGSTAGTITFPDADAGGGANIFVFPGTSAANYSDRGAPSDIISWTNSQIRIRVPPSAGTGTMEVFNSSNVSQGTANITIDYAIIPVYNTFNGFATETSQFVNLINANNTGGYTFNMSSTGSTNLFTNTPAKNALTRAFDTWRCGTFVNFNLNLATATTTGYASDNENVILFDNSLPSGVLGRATSRFTASSNILCTGYNTFWRTNEIDIQFQVIPSTGFTWNYNSGGTTFTQYSFESVALHEIGHGHGMGHVIDNNKVMHYTLSNGSQNVTLASSDIAGGQYKVVNSAGPNCVVTPTPMVALINPCSPLQVDILSLEAHINGANNDIHWTTEHEKGISRYEVEHSIDGNEYSTLGSVFSKKNTANNEYDFVHENPETNSNYYRLKIVDGEEKVSYSNSIYLIRNDRNNYAIYPNPTNGELSINLVGLPQQENRVAYKIMDMKGRIWYSETVLVDGRNKKITTNLSSLPAGMYLVQLCINGDVSMQKIVKQ